MCIMCIYELWIHGKNSGFILVVVVVVIVVADDDDDAIFYFISFIFIVFIFPNPRLVAILQWNSFRNLTESIKVKLSLS